MQLPDSRKIIRRLVLPLAGGLAVLFACLWAYLWYEASGRMEFEGVLAGSDYLLVAGQDGEAASVEAVQGDIVITGQPLLRFDNSATRKDLEAERQRLIQLARMLPPEHIRLPDPDDPSVGNETLTRRLARKGAAEKQAVQALQAASDEEARAAVQYNQTSIQFAQGRQSRKQLDAAQKRLDESRQKVRAARKRQELLSMQRATAETAIRRLLEFHATSGTDKIPLEERLENYETQRRLVEHLARSVSVAYLAAPFEGVLQEVLVRPGQRLEETTPCFVLQPTALPLTLNCSVEAERAVRLETGQQCVVVFPGFSKSEIPAYVASVDSGTDPAWREVRIGIIREGMPEAGIPPGTRGRVSVLLKKPPYTPDYIQTLSKGSGAPAVSSSPVMEPGLEGEHRSRADRMLPAAEEPLPGSGGTDGFHGAPDQGEWRTREADAPRSGATGLPGPDVPELPAESRNGFSSPVRQEAAPDLGPEFIAPTPLQGIEQGGRTPAGAAGILPVRRQGRSPQDFGRVQGNRPPPGQHLTREPRRPSTLPTVPSRVLGPAEARP